MWMGKKILVFSILFCFFAGVTQVLAQSPAKGDLIFALQTTATPIPMPGNIVQMDVSVEPQEIQLDESATVKINLSGDNEACGESVVVKPVDVFLVIDHSGSMDGDPLAQAKVAAKAFVAEMDLASDRVGIVQFDSSAQIVQTLTNDAALLSTAIDSVGGGGGTSIDQGLSVAFAEIQTKRREEAIPVIVILSDGGSSYTSAMWASNTAQAAKVKIVSVGVGSVDQTLMTDIASKDRKGKPLAYFTTNPSDLQNIYVTIAKDIREYGLAKDLVLRYQVDIYKFKVVPDTLSPAGVISGDTIIWEKDLLENGDNVFSFQVRGREAGDLVDIGKFTEAVFLECEQIDRTLLQEAGPQLTLSDVPPEIPALPNQCTSSDLFPWWVPPLLLFILLLLWLFTPLGLPFLKRLRRKGLGCKIMALLWAVFVLLLTALISKALIGVCKPDQVYFWKLTNGDAFVFQTMAGSDIASPVEDINGTAGCVACHAINNRKEIASVKEKHNGEGEVLTLNGNGVPVPAFTASYVAWSPDGKKLAVSFDDKDIFIVDVATGGMTPLQGASTTEYIETMPAWSPDGQRLAFVRAKNTASAPYTAEINSPCDIYTVPITGGVALPLPGASGDGFNYYPAYSPDGKWLAFTRHTEGTDTYADDSADIYIVPASGGESIQLRVNSDVSDSWPSWSPDSQWLGFSSNRVNGQFDILITPIGENGQSYAKPYTDGKMSALFKIAGAALPEDEEFHPVWLSEPQMEPLEELLALWPWLLSIIPLIFFTWYFCRQRKANLTVIVVDGLTGEPISNAEVRYHRVDEEAENE
jgi:uncharacterized protein YegL